MIYGGRVDNLHWGHKGVVSNCFNDILEEDLWGEGVTMINDRLSIGAIPTVHWGGWMGEHVLVKKYQAKHYEIIHTHHTHTHASALTLYTATTLPESSDVRFTRRRALQLILKQVRVMAWGNVVMGEGVCHVLIDSGAPINIDDVILWPEHKLSESIETQPALVGKDPQL